MIKKKVFIFGASKVGEAVFETLREKYEIVGFIDNDPQKTGTTFNGVKIFSPAYLVHYHEKFTVVIASMYYKEISQQLRDMGIRRYKNYYHRYSYGLLCCSSYWKLLFYPLLLLLTTPVQLVRTLWCSKVLINGNWRDYSQYHSKTGFAYLYYKVAALNLYRFGRQGTSPFIGTGNFKLSRWIHFTLPSLYIYWIAGPVSLLLGIFGWWVAHSVWVSNVPPLWLLAVMFLALFSTTFYANGFVLQNYNILGWAFFPLGLYALMTSHWLLAAIIWFLISYFSLTVLFIGGIITIGFGFLSSSLFPVVVLIPAGIKMIIHSIPSFAEIEIKEILGYFAKAVGVTNVKAKYLFTSSRTLFCEKRLFYLIIYIQFLLAVYFIKHQISYLMVIGIIIFLINSLLTRFADEQSIYMMMFSLATVVTLQISDFRLLFSYWILISPPPMFLNVPVKEVYSILPRLKPFNMKPFIDGAFGLLQEIPKREKVLIAFSHPQGVYEKLFGVYRNIFELLTYTAVLREINVFPDWHAVFENNYEGAPEFWGRDLNSVKENLKIWNAKYVIIYQTNNGDLDPVWEINGFKKVSEFHWNDYQQYLQDSPLPETENLVWWLLQYSSEKLK